MVQSIIDINEDEDRILNIVKAQYNLKNKSQAVAFIAKKYRDSFLEPELLPTFISKINEIKKEKGIKFSSIQDLKQSIEKNERV